MKTWAAGALLAATLFGCQRECVPTISNGDWTYSGRTQFSLAGSTCVRQLAYRGRPLAGGTYLVTPIGSYRIMVASEHGDAAAGWERISDRSSVAIPPGPVPATPQQVKEGFVAAESDSLRPRGIPPTWAYLGDAIDPGWVAPERLTDLDFVMRHPARRFRGTSQDPHAGR